MKPLLLVDGYNIIGAWETARREGWDFAESRDRLTALLQDYAGYTGQEVVLVFDGYKADRPSRHVESRLHLTVVFTRKGETADQYIEREMDRLPAYRVARVATSDALEQTMILGRGATRLSARELLRELSESRQDSRREASRTAAPARDTLFSRLPAHQQDALERIRRQK